MEEIKKLLYRNGMPLGKSEFENEQLYHTSLRRIHNYYFYGCGIVSGLELKISAESSSLEITPGFAMIKRPDLGENGAISQATEALMFKSRKVDLGTHWPALDNSKSLYVWITFLEEAVSGTSSSGGSGEPDVQNYIFERIKHHVGVKPPANNGEDLILGLVKLKVELRNEEQVRQIEYLQQESELLRLKCPGVIPRA